MSQGWSGKSCNCGCGRPLGNQNKIGYAVACPQYNAADYIANGPARRAYAAARRTGCPACAIWASARSRAKRKNVPFDILVEDIEIPETCPYLGIPLVQNMGQPGAGSITLDRIDPTRGYVKGNIRVISYLANTMKQNATREELLAFAQAVFRLHTERQP